MTKDEAKKVIKCVVAPAGCGSCNECPSIGNCSGGLEDCKRNVHEAAKVLYGGGYTDVINERNRIAEKFLDRYMVEDTESFSESEIDAAFNLADYFISKSQETDK